MLKTLVIAAATAAALLPLPAHSSIVGSNPEDGSTLTSLPDAFSVTTNEDVLAVEGSSSTVILITDESGAYYGDGCTSVDGTTLSTAADIGEPGVYTMRYGFVSADGHPIEGAVTFAWEPAEDVPAAAGATEAPVCGAAEPSTSESPSTSTAPSTSETPMTSTAPTPSADDASGGEDGGASPLVLIGIGAALLAVVIGAIVAMRRRGRRTGSDDGSAPEGS